MDNDLQDRLRVLKLGYIKKLQGILPEFKVLSEKISVSIIDEIYMKVHTISGTSGMYGLNELSSLSTDFELYLKKIKNDENSYDEQLLKNLLNSYIENIKHLIEGENNG